MSRIENRLNLKANPPNPADHVPPSEKPRSRHRSHFRNENKLPPADPVRTVPNLKVTISKQSDAGSRKVDAPEHELPEVRLQKCALRQETKRLASIRRKLEEGQVKILGRETVPRKQKPVVLDEDEPMVWEAIREQEKVGRAFEEVTLAKRDDENRRLAEISEKLRLKQLEIELKEERKRAILSHQAHFQTLLNVFMDTLAGYDKEFVDRFATQEKSVLDLIESFNQLLGTGGGQESTQRDVDRTAEFCKQLERINSAVIDLRNRMLKERGLIDEVSPQISNPTVSEEGLKLYTEIKNFHDQAQLAVQSLLDDTSFFVYRKNLRTVVNLVVNTMSGSSARMVEQFHLLDALLAGQRVQAGGVTVTTDGAPAARTYSALMLAEKFVHQADVLVSNNPPAAFPIAAVIVALWRRHPDFGRLFLAFLFRECPYLAPYYPVPSDGQSQQDYLKSLGYKLTPDGVPERQILYLKRMAALARLYGAIVVTNPAAIGEGHPHGLDCGWRWICSVLNLAPLADICATLITEFLGMAGEQMWIWYGEQFAKVLKVLYEKYVPMLPKGEGWPKARLERLLVKIKVEGRIERPIGALEAGLL